MTAQMDRRRDDSRIAVLEEQMRVAGKDHADMREDVKALRGEIAELRDEVRMLISDAKASSDANARLAKIGGIILAAAGTIGGFAVWAWQHVRITP